MKKRAFTIAELLVIIAIISVLAGLMIPALQRAKRAAMYTKAMNGKELKEKDIAAVIEHCKDNENARDRLIIKHPKWAAHFPDAPDLSAKINDAAKSTMKNDDPPKMNFEHEAKLKQKISALEKKIVDLESDSVKNIKPQPHKYEIKDKNDGFGWKYIIVRNGEEVFIGRSKSECEKILELVKEGFVNGIEVEKSKKE